MRSKQRGSSEDGFHDTGRSRQIRHSFTAERAATKVNPADLPSRNQQLSFETEPTEDLATLGEYFRFRGLSRILQRADRQSYKRFYESLRQQAVMGRVVSMRVSLRQASGGEMQLKVHARPARVENNRKSLDGLTRIAGESPEFDCFGAAWRHANARCLPWQSEANREAVTFEEDRLLVAGTLVGAECEVSRSFNLSVVEAYIFKISAAANTQITGRWRGRRLRLISFPASAP